MLNLSALTLKEIEEKIKEIKDPDQILELIEKEKEDQWRTTVIDLLNKYYQYLMLSTKGYNIPLLTKLLSVPFYDKNKTKEPFTTTLQRQIIERDNKTCQLCYNRNGKLIVHHIEPQGSASPNNLITLCSRCHNAIHKLLVAKGYKHYQR